MFTININIKKCSCLFRWAKVTGLIVSHRQHAKVKVWSVNIRTVMLVSLNIIVVHIRRASTPTATGCHVQMNIYQKQVIFIHQFSVLMITMNCFYSNQMNYFATNKQILRFLSLDNEMYVCWLRMLKKRKLYSQNNWLNESSKLNNHIIISKLPQSRPDPTVLRTKLAGRNYYHFLFILWFLKV